MKLYNSHTILSWNPTIQKFINYIMRNGKKTLAMKLLDRTFEEIKKQWQKKPEEILFSALENVMPKVEVRPKRIGGSIYQIPQEVKPKRQLFLASKWILTSARQRKGMCFSKALALELIDATNETGSAFKKKIEVHKMAEANKAFARFAGK